MIESKRNELNWAEVNAAWSSADKSKTEPKKRVDLPKIPDGKYVACSAQVIITTTKSNLPCLLWMLDIQEGEYASRRVFKRNMMVTEKNMEFLAKDLHTCNVALPEKLEDLDTTKLEDLTLAIAVRTKDTYTDVYINRLVDMEAATSNVTNAFDDDDIPF